MAGSPVPRRLTVDGEVFEVRPSENGHGHHFDWVSGPNPGYGFTIRTSDGSAVPRDQLVSQIRAFLGQIDPQTGYIAD